MLGRTNVPLMSVAFPELDGSARVPAQSFQYDLGTWELNRDAAGQVGLIHVPKLEVVHAMLNLNEVFNLNKIGSDPLVSPVGAEYWSGYSDPSSLPGGGGGGSAGVAGTGGGHYFRGIQISGFDLIYTISTAALTSASVATYRTLWANNAAPVTTATPGGVITGTHAVATQANPYLSLFTFATPYVLGNNVADNDDWLEITISFAATSGYEFYGANVYYNYVLL